MSANYNLPNLILFFLFLLHFFEFNVSAPLACNKKELRVIVYPGSLFCKTRYHCHEKELLVRVYL